MQVPTGLYIHIPFCKAKCSYCDFYSVGYTESLADDYIKALVSEYSRLIAYFGDITFDSVYIGGGTPSMLTEKQLSRLVETLNNSGRLKSDLEFSIEVNPESASKFEFYRRLGINRLSIGIQSLNDNILKRLNRVHTARDAMRAIKEASNFFNNISADLMIGLPAQTSHDVVDTLNQIIPYITHLSAYILKLASNTQMHREVQENIIILPEDDVVIDQYEDLVCECAKFGLERYEISNFSKADEYNSKHNLKYWKCQEYCGIGSSAHSFLNRKRFSNDANIFEYINDAKQTFPNTYESVQKNSDSDILLDTIMLGLRLVKGIDIEKVNKEFKIDFLRKFESKIKKLRKFVEYKGGMFFIKPEYLTVQNSIVVEFF
ncbi:MAG: radical SAM family heme chaperone HemW [Christensenellaceae bacterium]|jgi:oxygen-independent coproporphyrinogen-3 oxidase|nr:radical SAM family heme chaperone HemW [Christensenellaceae bacterium]